MDRHVDLRYLDVRFLSYYLTGEKVEINWIPTKEFPNEERGPTKFFVGYRIVEGMEEPVEPEDADTIIEFQRLPYSHMKLNSRSGQEIFEELIDSVIGLGIRHHSIPSSWNNDRLIKSRLEPFQDLTDPKYGPWINHEAFIHEAFMLSIELGTIDTIYWFQKTFIDELKRRN